MAARADVIEENEGEAIIYTWQGHRETLHFHCDTLRSPQQVEHNEKSPTKPGNLGSPIYLRIQ